MWRVSMFISYLRGKTETPSPKPPMMDTCENDGCAAILVYCGWADHASLINWRPRISEVLILKPREGRRPLVWTILRCSLEAAPASSVMKAEINFEWQNIIFILALDLGATVDMEICISIKQRVPSRFLNTMHFEFAWPRCLFHHHYASIYDFTIATSPKITDVKLAGLPRRTVESTQHEIARTAKNVSLKDLNSSTSSMAYQ